MLLEKNEMKLCRSCGETKQASDFHNCERQRRQSRCKKCKSDWAKAYYAKNADVRSKRKLSRYGITEEDRLAIRKAQGGKCAICKEWLQGGQKEHIDHCHETNLIRGILCSECNTGLGKLGDNADRLRAAISYLEDNPCFDVRAWWKSVK